VTAGTKQSFLVAASGTSARLMTRTPAVQPATTSRQRPPLDRDQHPRHGTRRRATAERTAAADCSTVAAGRLLTTVAQRVWAAPARDCSARCEPCRRHIVNLHTRSTTQISSKSMPMSSSPSLPSIAMSTAVSLIRAVSGSSPYCLRLRASSALYLWMMSTLSSW